MNLKISNLVKKYDDKTVLDQINLDIQDFQVLALIGASGSGKSTLLRLIAGLEGFEGGTITVNEDPIQDGHIDAYRKRVGFVFQDHNLFNHLTVLENLLLVLEKVHRKKRKDILPKIETLLKQFDLLEHKDKLPHQLSGGQSQRVSIVRALSIEPEIILLDEPTSSLDPILTFEVLSAVEKLGIQKKDFIIVTHEIGFAKHTADYIVFMQEGRIIEHGDVSVLDRPESVELQAFLSKVLTFKVED
jgi:polar amino acid transport system ATP-binding protein